MGLKIKQGNPFVVNNTDASEIERYNQIAAVYYDQRENDPTYDVRIEKGLLTITRAGVTKKAKIPDATFDLEWLLSRMRGDNVKRTYKGTRPKIERMSGDAKGIVKSLKAVVKDEGYCYLDEANDRLVVVNGIVTSYVNGYANLCMTNFGFHEAVSELINQSANARKLSEENERMRALLKEKGIKL